MGTVTMEDIARRAGVSRALVSMAFRDVPGVSAATRDHILATADAMGYRFNRLASRLARKAATTFGVFLLDLRQDVYADMFDGISAVAKTNDKHIVMAVGASDGSLDAAALETLAQSQVDVVIATGLLLPDADVVAFNAQVPLVSVARRVDGVDSACTNNLRGARLATEHLLGLGHRRIAFLANPQTDGYLDRRLGYLAAMGDAGLAGDVVVSRYSRQQAAVDAHDLLARGPANRPTAIFAHNDQAALGALDAAAELGLGVPGDVSVVGYDNSQLSRGASTNLTTVDLHGSDLGRDAAELALRRLADSDAPPETRTSAPSLVVRGTTGPVREAG